MASPLKELYLKIPAKKSRSLLPVRLIKVIVTLELSIYCFHIKFSFYIIFRSSGGWIDGHNVQGDRIVVAALRLRLSAAKKAARMTMAILQLRKVKVFIWNNCAGKFLSMDGFCISGDRQSSPRDQSGNILAVYCSGDLHQTDWGFSPADLCGIIFAARSRDLFSVSSSRSRQLFDRPIHRHFLLPSTIGLDGYKLYDASRFSRRTVECTATVIEKVLGIVGLFITFLVALPFWMKHPWR